MKYPTALMHILLYRKLGLYRTVNVWCI